MVKLEVPPIVKAPVFVIVPPEVTLRFPVVVTSTPKSTLDPASRVKPLNEDAVVEKVIEEAEFKVRAPKLVEVTPSTVMAPFVPSPIVRLPAVIFVSSVESRFIANPVNPNPKVPPLETLMVVEPVPLLIVPVKAISLAVTASALPEVDKADERVKSPVLSLSELEFKVVVPLVVRSEEIVIPFSALTVNPWKVEAVV